MCISAHICKKYPHVHFHPSPPYSYPPTLAAWFSIPPWYNEFMGIHMHRLKEIDLIAKTAVCSTCGPVDIYLRDKVRQCRNARRESRRKYYKTHPEKRRQSNTPAYKAGQLRRHLRRDKEIRAECIEHYGGRCVFCGDSNPHHLTFDHINNDGNMHRKKVPSARFTRWLKRNNFPEDIQLLCWNHNMEKAIYHTLT